MTFNKWFPAHPLLAALIALGLLATIGVPAMALTGVFQPHREPDGLVRLSKRQIVAEGSTPERDHWRLVASRSNVGFCLGIELPSGPRGATVTTVSEGCGTPEPGSLSVATVSGGSRRQNGLAFGTAPEDAQRVRVEARGVAVTVETLDDNLGLHGRFYLAELPVRTSLGATSVVALGGNNEVIGSATIGEERRGEQRAP